MIENSTAADRYLERATDFLHGARAICEKPTTGWLPSASLLLGMSCELLAKQRLLRDGVSAGDLRGKPYGHDIAGMWKEKTNLYSQAEKIVEEFKLKPNPNGVDEKFDWDLHFAQLANGHSLQSDYSIRYHNGEIHFPNPIGMTVVLSNLAINESRSSSG